MIHRFCSRLLSLPNKNILSSRASLHISSIQLAKKKTDPPAASKSPPPKEKKPAPKASKEPEGYAAGEMFFSYNPYSFYDIENDMAKDRVPQPSSRQPRPSLSS